MIIPHIIVPFRDRGTDPLRSQNLARVLESWEDEHGWPVSVVSDGRKDKELFNRSAAYNRGVEAARNTDCDVLVFAESDMLIGVDELNEACKLALEGLGMVVPFTTYCYHAPESSVKIRNREADPGWFVPKWVMDNCTSVGAINVMSRDTMDTLGQFDEKFEGNWYDDDATKIALEVCAGATTRFVAGKGHHLYHLPGHRGKHLTDMEKMATKRNQKRLGLYESAAATNNVAMIRRLLKGEL